MNITINGATLGSTITGFTLLKVSGREGLEKKLEFYEETRRDGKVLHYTKYPERKIEVEFAMGPFTSEANYISACSSLHTELLANESKIAFDDDTGSYFIGTPYVTSIDRKGMGATGKIQVVCSDPFRYSTTETAVSGTPVTVEDVPLLAFTPNVQSGYNVYPKFEVQFADDTSSSGVIGSRGECGYVLFTKGDSSLQFGDDEEKDTTTADVSTDFRNITLGGDWKQTTTLPLPSWSYLHPTPQGTSTIVSSGGGLRVNAYGTARSNKVYGPMVYTTLPVAVDGEFEFSWKQIFCMHYTTSIGVKQMGMVLICFYDENDNIAYSFGVKKLNQTALTGEVVYFDSNGIQTLKNKVDFSWTGGLAYKTSRQYDARYTTQTLKRVQDEDGIWHIQIDSPLGNFQVGNYDSAVSIKKIGVFQGAFNGKAVPTVNAFTTAKFNGGQIDLLNTFQPADELIVDCSDASVTLNNSSEPSLGDVANDWSTFYLTPGANTVYATYSDWIPSGYEPTITLKYRERWL